MKLNHSYSGYGYWLLTSVLFIGSVTLLFVYVPVETTMGPVQKIFYIHLPVAINTFIAALLVCISGFGYLRRRSMLWDDLASATTEITVLFCATLLITGMIWGKSAWGHWWTWTPRLTFSLVLFLLYVVLLLIRPAIESPQKRAMICAVYGIVAFLDVPLVYLSVKLMPVIHPASIVLEPEMKLALLIWFVPITMLMAGLVVMKFRLNRRIRTLALQSKDDANVPIRLTQAGGAR